MERAIKIIFLTKYEFVRGVLPNQPKRISRLPPKPPRSVLIVIILPLNP